MKHALSAMIIGSGLLLVLACASEDQEAVGEAPASVVPCVDSGGSVAGGGTPAGAGAGGAAASGGKPAGGAGGAPFVPGPPYVAPAHQGNLIHVKNGCAFPLWIHGYGGGGILTPDDQKLESGSSLDYSRGDWPFAYVDAYLDGPQQNRIERAEVTFFPANYVSYRLNYIDGIGLPMELQAIGPGTDCKPVGCYMTQAQVVASCPTSLVSGKRCLSASQHCQAEANAQQPLCHALDAAIAQCAGSVPGCADAALASTAQAYGCDRSFGDKPQLCAALNRGMLQDPASSDSSLYYGGAHNPYAAWLHGSCPGLAAFPYDDANVSQDSFHTCIDAEGGTQLNITFCPAG